MGGSIPWIAVNAHARSWSTSTEMVRAKEQLAWQS